MNDVTGSLQLAAEQRARVLIDRQLTDASWSVQDGKRIRRREIDEQRSYVNCC